MVFVAIIVPMKQLLARSSFRVWLAVFGTATLVLAGSYTMAQQSTRLSADNLPLSTAQTAQHELAGGAQPSDVVSALKTDLRNDSMAFVIVTDSTQHILASSATLDGKTPLPPTGTFTFTKDHGTDHFAWEPASEVRLATRIITYQNGVSSGFVIAGQSLKQTESHITDYGRLALATWLAVLAWTLFLVMMPERNKKA